MTLAKGGGSSTITTVSGTTNGSASRRSRSRTPSRRRRRTRRPTPPTPSRSRDRGRHLHGRGSDGGAVDGPAAPASVTANGVTTSTITVTLKDVNVDPVPEDRRRSRRTAAPRRSPPSPAVTNALGRRDLHRQGHRRRVDHLSRPTQPTHRRHETATVTFTPGADRGAVDGDRRAAVTADDAHHLDDHRHAQGRERRIPCAGKTVTLAKWGGPRRSPPSRCHQRLRRRRPSRSRTRRSSRRPTPRPTRPTPSPSPRPRPSPSPPAPSTRRSSTVAAAPARSSANGARQLDDHRHRRDAFAHPLAGQTVTLAQGAGSSTITVVSGTTNASGQRDLHHHRHPRRDRHLHRNDRRHPDPADRQRHLHPRRRPTSPSPPPPHTAAAPSASPSPPSTPTTTPPPPTPAPSTFTSNDGQAALPANYTFTGADNGSHTFTRRHHLEDRRAAKTVVAPSPSPPDHRQHQPHRQHRRRRRHRLHPHHHPHLDRRRRHHHLHPHRDDHGRLRTTPSPARPSPSPRAAATPHHHHQRHTDASASHLHREGHTAETTTYTATDTTDTPTLTQTATVTFTVRHGQRHPVDRLVLARSVTADGVEHLHDHRHGQGHLRRRGRGPVGLASRGRRGSTITPSPAPPTAPRRDLHGQDRRRARHLHATIERHGILRRRRSTLHERCPGSRAVDPRRRPGHRGGAIGEHDCDDTVTAQGLPTSTELPATVTPAKWAAPRRSRPSGATTAPVSPPSPSRTPSPRPPPTRPPTPPTPSSSPRPPRSRSPPACRVLPNSTVGAAPASVTADGCDHLDRHGDTEGRRLSPASGKTVTLAKSRLSTITTVSGVTNGSGVADLHRQGHGRRGHHLHRRPTPPTPSRSRRQPPSRSRPAQSRAQSGVSAAPLVRDCRRLDDLDGDRDPARRQQRRAGQDGDARQVRRLARRSPPSSA